MATIDIWTYRQQADESPDLIGYEVEALDGGSARSMRPATT